MKMKIKSIFGSKPDYHLIFETCKNWEEVSIQCFANGEIQMTIHVDKNKLINGLLKMKKLNK
jgi:hypothetical protein